MGEIQGEFNIVCIDYVDLILGGIRRLYESEEDVDLTLHCDGFDLKLHRWLIRVFAPQLLVSRPDNLQPTSDIDIKDKKISRDILKLAFEFVYRGEVTVSNSKQLELLRYAAEKLKWETLLIAIDKVRPNTDQPSGKSCFESGSKRTKSALVNYAESDIDDDRDCDWQPDLDKDDSIKGDDNIIGEETTKDGKCSNQNARKTQAAVARRICNIRCINCEYLTQDTSEYVKHVNQDHPYDKSSKKSNCRCAQCDFTGPHKRALRSHWRETHRTGRQRKFRCGECNFVALKKILLDRHTQNQHATDRPFRCHRCDYRATKMINLKYHLQLHEGRKFTCETCGKKCTSASGLCKHRKLHTGYNKFYVCHICQFPFRMRSSLNSHLVDIHRQPAVEQPDNVPRGRPKRRTTAEVKSVSDVSKSGGRTDCKRFRCAECPFATRIQRNLDLHVRTQHRDERPFTCETCGYNTKTMNALRSHLTIHRNEKVLCEICHKSYSSKSKLKRHLVVMHDPHARRYMCHVCGFATKTNDGLSLHMRRMHKDAANVQK